MTLEEQQHLYQSVDDVQVNEPQSVIPAIRWHNVHSFIAPIIRGHDFVSDSEAACNR